jgi:hypothetical protein
MIKPSNSKVISIQTGTDSRPEGRSFSQGKTLIPMHKALECKHVSFIKDQIESEDGLKTSSEDEDEIFLTLK